MKKIILCIAILSACLLFSNCTLNATNYNNYNDQEDAKKVANKLFGAQIDHNYTEADKLFSKEFYKVTPADTMHKIFDTTTKKLGKFKSDKLLKCETLDVAGTNARTEYLCVYEIEYEKYKAIVTLGMLKKDDEADIKIMKYNIDSPGFLQ